MAAAGEWMSIGRRVREGRLAARLSQDELGRRLGLDRTMVAKIEAGTRRVDAVELVRLGAGLGLPLGFFLRERPAVIARRSGALDEEATEAGRASFRLEAELVGWLHDVRQLHSLGVLESSPLLGYARRVETEASAREAAGWLRRRLDLGDGPIVSMVKVGQDAGVLIAVADLPGDGAAVRDDDVAVAVVGRRGHPGRCRMAAAHELGHLLLGDDYSSHLGDLGARAEREAVVDAFAEEFLLPSAVVGAEGEERGGLVRLAARYRTSWPSAVRQAVRAGVAGPDEAASWLPLRPARAELLDATGWDPQPDLEWIRVPPGFAHAVLEAHRRHLVTTARAVELMRGQIEDADLPPVEDVVP